MIINKWIFGLLTYTLFNFFLIFSARRVCIYRELCRSKMSVCLSVRLSIRPSQPVLCVNGLHKSSSFYTPPSIVFSRQTGWQYSDGDPPNGGVECKKYKKPRFSTNIGLYLGTDARQRHSYYGRRIGNRTQSLMVPVWMTFSDLFKVTNDYST